MARAQGTITGVFVAVTLLLGLNLFVTPSAAALGREYSTAHGDATPATTRIRATVLSSDGTPIKGAVIVTNAGGQGVTDAQGVALFGVAVDTSVHELSVTGAGAVGGVNLVGNVRLRDVRPGGETPAGTIVLEAGGQCQPQWLPTFGGAPVNGDVYALTVYDDGSGGGPALYGGGWFTSAGRVTANHVAKWDGSSWSAVGSGANSGVLALTVFDDGSGGGPALYAGGGFTSAGGVAANRIARWDGSSWSALGSGISGAGGGEVDSLTVYDDGSGGGPALYAGGSFTSAGGAAADRIARWDGSSWSALGSGIPGTVQALTVYDDGSGGGPALYAGGWFTLSPAGDSYLARWGGCPLCPWDLDRDSAVGIVDLLALLAAWGTDPGGPPDFDGDGTVGITDLLELLANWGPCK